MGFLKTVRKSIKKSSKKSRKSIGKIGKTISKSISKRIRGNNLRIGDLGSLAASSIGVKLGTNNDVINFLSKSVPAKMDFSELLDGLSKIPLSGFKAILTVLKENGLDLIPILDKFREGIKEISLPLGSRATNEAIFKYINDVDSYLLGVRPFAVQDGQANFIDYDKKEPYYVVVQTIINIVFGIKMFISNFAHYLNFPYDQYLTELYKLNKLGLNDYIVLRRRDLIRDTTLKEMTSYLGYDDATRKHASDLLDYFPSVGDLIDFAVKEAFEPDEKLFIHDKNAIPVDFIEYGKKAGMSESWIKRHWHIHWRLLGTGQILESWHRKITTETELDDYLRRLDYTENDRRIIKGMSFNLLTRVDVRRVFENGLMSSSELFEYYKTLGYSEKDSGLMTGLSKQIRFIETKDLRKLYIEQYDNGFLTEREINNKLKATGLDPNEIELFLYYTDSLKELDFKKELKKQIELRFYEGIIDYDDLIKQLRNLGVSNREITRIERNASLFDFKKPRLPTIAELKRYIKKGLIDLNKFVYYCLRLGYSIEIIEIMLRDINILE